MALYHKEVFWKDNFDEEALKLISSDINDIWISKHTIDHIAKVDAKHKYDRKEIFGAVYTIKKHSMKPFEVETVGDEVVKGVWRLHNKARNVDICISMRKNLVVTAWINTPSDKHATLDKSKYCTKQRAECPLFFLNGIF